MKIRPIDNPKISQKIRRMLRARDQNASHFKFLKEKTWKLISKEMGVDISDESSNALAYLNGKHVVVEEFTSTDELLNFSYGYTDQISPLKKMLFSQLDFENINKIILEND